MLSGIRAQHVIRQLFLARINIRQEHAPRVEGDGAGDEFAEVEHMLIDTIYKRSYLKEGYLIRHPTWAIYQLIQRFLFSSHLYNLQFCELHSNNTLNAKKSD